MTASPALTGLSTEIEALYVSIADRCHNINITGHIAAGYTSVLSAINTFANERITKTLPYIKTLAKKAKENHNCQTCSGACAMQHDMTMVNMVSSHHQLEDKMKELAAILNDNKPEQPIHSMLSALHRAVSSLIQQEKEQLIPLIREAKTKINAR